MSIQYNTRQYLRVIQSLDPETWKTTGFYVELNQLLPKHRSAYQKFHSTETAVLKLVSDDRHEVTLLGLLDLSAAFDTVDHDILLGGSGLG